MAIDDNQRSREAVLARVRAALGRADPTTRRARPRMRTSRRDAQGPRPGASGRSRAALSRSRVRHGEHDRTRRRPSTPSPTRSAATSTRSRRADPRQNARAGVCWPEFAIIGLARSRHRRRSRVRRSGMTRSASPDASARLPKRERWCSRPAADTPSATFLLPETHVAIVRAGQIVPAMEDAFARVRAERGELPRAINLVSGPSRTGDIEQTIVLGAHGPRRLQSCWSVDVKLGRATSANRGQR